MKIEFRKLLCNDCLIKIRKEEAKYKKWYRLKIKQRSEQEKGKIKINKK